MGNVHVLPSTLIWPLTISFNAKIKFYPHYPYQFDVILSQLFHLLYPDKEFFPETKSTDEPSDDNEISLES